VLIKKIQN